ncbi:MAG: HEPN domain-containing protein [Planctomycetota bacterium]|nr:HEPN domain-containing protein [Planctomycetota bacterium]
MTAKIEIVRDPVAIKSRFKAICKSTDNAHQNWQIRVHRALSWYKRAVEFPPEHAEARFLYLWIAFNSLYSRWDPQKNAPAHDHDARSDFVRRLVDADPNGVLPAALNQHRPLVKKILGNAFISPIFWRNPHNSKAHGHATEDANYLEKNYREHNHLKLLGQTFDRLYVLRGQIVHGASSGGSSLNRTTLRHCQVLLEQVMPVVLHVAIEHGCHDDWPELCYPPVR